jgi:dGTP triphosphohydrolase
MEGNYGREGKGELIEDGVTSEFREICKNFAFDEVFSSSGIITRESKGRRIIADLMEFFWEGTRHTHWVSAEDDNEENEPEVEVEGEFAERAYNLMSENYKLVFERDMSPERVEETGLPREYRQLQLVADYICGMTDGFAQSLHKDLFNG